LQKPHWWFALVASVLSAQTITTGEVTGSVADSTGALVPAATVVLKSLDTGETRSVQSNAAGVYRFTFIKPGDYQISATSAGLKSDTGRVTAALGQVQSVDLGLTLEEVKEALEVTDAAPLLERDNANVTYTPSTRYLNLLPLPGGDMSGVAYSVPGIVVNNRYGKGNFASPGVGSVSNLFTVNGSDDMDPFYNVNNSGVTGLLLGVNEIREASVVQNAYEGQYGRQAGAQVNYVTKSGANAWHGNLVENYNASLLNANEFFSNATGAPRPHAISNQYAASLGGRIIRNKLFFFADTEGMRYALPVAAAVVAIPSPALESYTLGTIQPSQVTLYKEAFDLYNAAPGHDRAVPVTNGDGPLQDGNQALGCGALAGTPAGNGGIFGVNVPCSLAWGTSLTAQTSEWLLSTRVDYNLSAKQRIFFRFKTDRGFQPTNTSAVNSAFSIISQQPDYEGQFNHTFAITPRLVNNFIGSASYHTVVFAVADQAAALQLFPVRFNVDDGGTNGSYDQIASVGPPAKYPQGRRAGQLQIVDDVSYNAGSHTLKAGLNNRLNREADLTYSAFDLTGLFTFYGLDEFADGQIDPSSGNGSYYTHRFSATPVIHLRLYSLGAYLQDQWAATPHLKLTATVRFDRTGNPYCLDHCFARLESPFPNLGKGLAIPYSQSIQAGLAHAFYDTEPVIPQPRFGMAYSPAWLKSTVVRGGIGLFSDLYAAFFADTMAGNPPNVFTPTIYSGLVNTGGPGSAPAIVAASANAFENQFARGATLAQLQQAVAPATFVPPGYYSIPPTLRSPKYLEWSFEIDRQFRSKNALSLRYIGNRGYDIFLTNNNLNAYAEPAAFPNGFAGLPATAPDPRFNVISQLTNSGYANYHALAAIFRRGFSQGFEGQIGYTWSHGLDTLSNGGLMPFSYDSLSGQINPYNLRSLNYSNADYDIRHNLTADFIWEIPVKWKNRAINSFFGGWSIAGRLNARTGTPFTVYNGRLGMRLSSGFTVLANVLDGNIRTICGHSAIDMPCFTASQFTPWASQSNLGNLPRNSFRGPGYFDVDTSLWKSVPMGERARFTLGASAYNFLNHPNFADPNADISRGGLGLIQGTASGPSGPYGAGGVASRVLVVTGRFAF
jgi:hypothetical protein